MPPLEPNEKLDVAALLEDLAHYRPRRKGWHWREQVPTSSSARSIYKQTSKGLTNSVPLPAAHYFDDIDPQPDCVVTTEIASGRFEDDIRRMRMAAWHGADHMMVIRTAGQSHMDGLLEGTPEGVGGIAVTRKQVRATRKALDLIEDEVGRPINFHSYVSGVAGPEMAVMFAEEGVNGAHQDPQYNVLYRNINMYRSFVDAAVAKHVMASVRMAQIDGAHNANATARRPGRSCRSCSCSTPSTRAYSVAAGMPKADICLSTVPPDAPPAPCMRMDLPYAVALRDLFGEYKMRAQQNTRYMESDGRDATVSHVMNLVISRLTSADIQSTITPDEGRNVPWHYNNVAAVNTAKQSLVGMDGLREHGQARPRRPRAARPRARAQGARRAVPGGHAAPGRLLRRRRGRATSSIPASTPRPTTTASCARATAAWPWAASSSAPPTTWRPCATTSATTTCPKATATHMSGAPPRPPASPATSSAAARCATPTRCPSSTSWTPKTTSTCA